MLFIYKPPKGIKCLKHFNNIQNHPNFGIQFGIQPYLQLHYF